MFCSKCGAELPGTDGMCLQCQNTAGVANVPPANIDSHMVMAILVTVLCCLPFGIVSLVYAAKVSSLVAAGKIDEAIIASETAKKWGWIGFYCGLACSLIWTIIQVIIFFIATANR